MYACRHVTGTPQPVAPGSTAMPRVRPAHRISLPIIQQIAAYIKAGGYSHVAAEAAGVPGSLFAEWLERARRGSRNRLYRMLQEEVARAAAEARLRAEVEVFLKKPDLWLRCGPGKDTAEVRGWSLPVRAVCRPDVPAHETAPTPVEQILCAATAYVRDHPEHRQILIDFVRSILPDPAARFSLTATGTAR